jgi:hypothetical protein
MPTQQGKTRQRFFEEEQRPFWLFSLVGLFVRAVLAYVLAVVLYIVVFHLPEAMNIGAVDPSLRSSFFFVLLALVVGACLLPLIQGTWTTDSRSFALMIAVSLVSITYAQATGITKFDPDADPEVLVKQHFVNYVRPYPRNGQPNLPHFPWTPK